jgi:hypothetical protein
MTCEDYVKALEKKAKKRKNQTNNENRKDKR